MENFAVTSSVRVQIYSSITKLVLKNISAFQKNAYGANYRRDGQLLIAGDEDAKVRVFDVNSKAILRLLKGHARPVHRAFFANDLHHAFSCSDDSTVKYWNITTERCMQTYKEHNDYVRAGAVNPISNEIFVSGGYDNQIKMFDTRSRDSVMHIKDVGAAIESLAFLPSGGLIVCAAGSDIKIFDAIAGGRQLNNISSHTKTVTCVKTSSDGRHIISGSLDRHVKVFNTTNFQAVHSIGYNSDVLSVDLAKDDGSLAVGTVDGILYLQRRDVKRADEKQESTRNYKKKRFHTEDLADEKVEKVRRDKLEKYDKLMRKFEYSEALNSVLTRYCMNKTPDVVVAVMHELLKRQGLETAFSHRTQDSIGKLLTFFNKYISQSRFTNKLIDIINVFMNVYEDIFHEQSPQVQKMFIQLHARIKTEEEQTLAFLKLQGELDIIMNAAAAADSRSYSKTVTNHEKLHPSDSAKKASLIKV